MEARQDEEQTVHRTFPDGVTSWIDVEQPDEAAALQFYGELFGWTFVRATPDQAPVPYWIAKLDGRDVAGVGRADAAAWNTYVSVSDSQGTIARLETAGGRVLSGPDAAGEGGLSTICSDPQGLGFRLWEPKRRLGVQAANEPGAWNFSNLSTDDPAAAQDFYRRVFGWAFTDVGFGTMIGVPGYGNHLAGSVDPTIHERQSHIAAPPGFADAIGWQGPVTEQEPAGWSVTFTVADRDETAATAQRLGATVLGTATDDYTRSATIRDPQGARFVASQFVPPEG